MRRYARRDGGTCENRNGVYRAGKVVTALMNALRRVGIIVIRGILISGICMLPVAGMLRGSAVHAGLVLLALECQPRRRRGLQRQPGKQEQ